MPGNWEDIFDIVEKENGFYAKFKHNGQLLNDLSPCEWAVYAESLAFNWCNNIKNDKEILNIISELTLLGDL